MLSESQRRIKSSPLYVFACFSFNYSSLLTAPLFSCVQTTPWILSAETVSKQKLVGWKTWTHTILLKCLYKTTLMNTSWVHSTVWLGLSCPAGWVFQYLWLRTSRVTPSPSVSLLIHLPPSTPSCRHTHTHRLLLRTWRDCWQSPSVAGSFQKQTVNCGQSMELVLGFLNGRKVCQPL